MRVELLLAAAAVACSLAIAEVSLRWLPQFDPQPQAEVGAEAEWPREPYLVHDAELGWRMSPNREFIHATRDFRAVYRSNALGFRDPPPARTGAIRRTIAIVGDSFSFGWGVDFEQTYGALLEARLPGTAVHNFAMPGYALDQMWLTAQKVALPIKPDLLIVAFISDDFTRSLTAHRYNMGRNKPTFTLDGGRLRPKTSADAPPAWLWYLANHSRLWAGVRHLKRLVAYHYPIGDWWELNHALLEAIRADCRAANTRLLFVYLFTQQARPFPTLAAYMMESSADFVDLGNRPPPPGRILTFSTDMHPNPDGHRYAAQEILSWIDREMPELPSGSDS